jgi:hypothetical protein
MKFRHSFAAHSIVIFVLALATGLRGNAQGSSYIAAASKDYDPKSGGRPFLPGGADYMIGDDGIAVSFGNVRSWWITTTATLTTYSDYRTTLNGSLTDATFSVYRDPERKRTVYDSRNGSASVENAKGQVIAVGWLTTLEDWLAIPGKKGASFKFESYSSPVTASWSGREPQYFATLSLNSTNDWTITDDRFAFLSEITTLNSPTAYVLLPESITRAAVINVPKGDIDLFGYVINSIVEGAQVKFRKGIPIECIKCSILHHLKL